MAQYTRSLPNTRFLAEHVSSFLVLPNPAVLEFHREKLKPVWNESQKEADMIATWKLAGVVALAIIAVSARAPAAFTDDPKEGAVPAKPAFPKHIRPTRKNIRDRYAG